VVPETLDADELAHPTDADARYRRPTEPPLPLVLGADSGEAPPADDPHDHPRR
jgi:hypothetical protein